MITDMCRLSTMAYRDGSFISDLFENFNGQRPHNNEFCALEKCGTCPTIVSGDLTAETDIIQNDAQAYVCRYEDSLAVVFRGTESFRDVLTDINMIRVRMDLPGLEGDLRPKVHWGFLRQFRTVEKEICEHIKKYMDDPGVKINGDVAIGEDSGKGVGLDDVRCDDVGVGDVGVGDVGSTSESTSSSASEVSSLIPRPIKHIVVSGHSLGGALATLAAVQFGREFPEATITCVSFGSPRVGNGKFCEYFDQCVGGSYRFVNEDDPVPMGPTPIRFTHVKGGRWIDDDVLLQEKPWMRSLTFFKNLFLSFFGYTHNPVSDHGCASYLRFISTMN